MRTNKLKAALKAGGIALGTIVWDTRGRGVMHTLAAAGMDFAWICTEHSAFNLETVVDMVAHAHAAGITPIVRIPDLQYEHVTRLLDSGCQSLILPHITGGAEVRRFIELAKYHPQGRRGMAIYLGASTDYEEVDLPAAMAHANANTLLAVMIETREALESADEILLAGVDLAIVGHQDLTQSLGIPGQYVSPIFRGAFEKVRSLCAARGIALAGLAAKPEDLQAVVESGARFILYGTDLVLMRREAERAARALAPLRKLAARGG
jgi:2-dehydro-3-deoxyglucarate aldolase/4-hydroxy-2-oxoheptanedioate aldolase